MVYMLSVDYLQGNESMYSVHVVTDVHSLSIEALIDSEKDDDADRNHRFASCRYFLISQGRKTFSLCIGLLLKIQYFQVFFFIWIGVPTSPLDKGYKFGIL